MKLKHLLQGLNRLNESEPAKLEEDIKNITADSREASAGDVFIAVKGTSVDGHDFIPRLIDKGVATFIVEKIPDEVSDRADFIVVESTRTALGIMASNFYGNPSKEIQLVGVTGTNGKTTIATLIYELARKEGMKAGLLSTIANYIDGDMIPATHTTPDPLSLNRLLREMVNRGCRVVAMEVSSHAAHQQRIAGLTFAGAIFTNLTRDHLDYHGTMADYRDAKKIFFDSLPSTAFALVNDDDRNGLFMLQNTRAHRYTYSIRSKADFEGRILEKHIGNTLITINGTELTTHFSGEYNISNLTAVYGAMTLLGFDPEETLIDISAMKPVAGRFQTFTSAQGITAVIDYAHTPDALENVLRAINDVRKPSQKVITVVGAGGNRDKGKRPIMARTAVLNSWKTILTSDNPRFENPLDILDDMKAGLNDEQKLLTLVIADRREAIKTAASLALPGDIILIAGKGHENYQEIEGVKYHFDDAEEIKKIFEIK